MAGGTKVTTAGLSSEPDRGRRALAGGCKSKRFLAGKKQKPDRECPGPRSKPEVCVDNADAFIDSATEAKATAAEKAKGKAPAQKAAVTEATATAKPADLEIGVPVNGNGRGKVQVKNACPDSSAKGADRDGRYEGNGKPHCDYVRKDCLQPCPSARRYIYRHVD